MPKPFIFSTLLLFTTALQAQYATSGTGNLRNQIWWLNWSGFTISEGASRVFTTADGLQVNVQFSQVSAHLPQPSVMNTWSGAVLHLLYDFTDPTVQPALYDAFSAVNDVFTLEVSATRNGSPVSFSLVATDAEGSGPNELNRLQTNGSSWQAIEFYRNSGQTINPLSGCGTRNVIISNTSEGNPQIGQIPVLLSRSSGNAPMIVNVTLDHSGEAGGMGVAFGVLDATDQGDLPVSYGKSQHQINYDVINGCNILPGSPGLGQVKNLYLGSIYPDADGLTQTDDNTEGADEESVSVFPVYNGSGSYTVPLNLRNATGGTAVLTAWFDKNRNGRFETNEFASIPVTNNATSASITWTGLPTYLPRGTATGYAFRFRLSTDDADVQKGSDYSPDGEVEDYFILADELCSVDLKTSPDTSICAGSVIHLRASGETQFTWTNEKGNIPGTENLSDITVRPAATTVYNVSANNPQGCASSGTINVSVLERPVTVVSNDTVICSGKSLQLSASGGDGYAWTSSDGRTGETAATITVNPASETRYFVSITGNNGCMSKDSVNVAVRSRATFVVNGKEEACLNEIVKLSASGGDEYNWYSSTGLQIGTDSVLYTQVSDSNDAFSVRITDDLCGISKTLETAVTVNPGPAVTIQKSNDIDCDHDHASLHADGGNRYSWDAGPGISDLSIPNPIVTPRTTTTYFVNVYDGNGCKSRDSILMLADLGSALSNYPVPTAFTPNNDGINDCFGLKGWGSLSQIEFAIYNRSGEELYSSRRFGECWDGSFQGIAQPSGGYIYQIKAVTACGLAYRKGVVLLIR